MQLVDAGFAQHIANAELSKEEAGIVSWVLSHTPTVDAEPVKHGRWKECGYKWRCSSCGVLMDIDGTPKENLLNYCPNCGAKMDLKGD